MHTALPRSNLNVACDLARAGMFVFPAIISWNDEKQKLDKQPAIKGWRDAATTDLAQFERWWHGFPDAVPGIELGRSRLFVVDLDRHPGGPDGVAAFKTIRGDNPIPHCPMVKTPSNGFHLYFRQPDGEPLGNGRGSLPDGIDIRGDGGWTVAPGASYKQWQWRAVRSGSPPPAPDWIIAAIRSQRLREPVNTREWKPCGDAWLRGLVRIVANASEGQRNSLLGRLSCRRSSAGRQSSRSFRCRCPR
jgi:Bifunctional DNA primase/polymerase, N-terminal